MIDLNVVLDELEVKVPTHVILSPVPPIFKVGEATIDLNDLIDKFKTPEPKKVFPPAPPISKIGEAIDEWDSMKQVETWGFYEKNHEIVMERIKKDSKVYVPISNFTIKVLYLIQGNNAKRIVELKNSYGKSITTSFTIEELISVDKFKMAVEKNGNFLFIGNGLELMRIKKKLFEFEFPCSEVTYVGHQKNFYAFSNGIYNYTDSKFYPINEYQVTTVNKENFFVPLIEGNNEDEASKNFKAAIYKPNADVTFKTWANIFCTAYGDNGKVGLAFGLMSMFLDVVKQSTSNKLPLLFFFGQKGSGKTTEAISLTSLFGEIKEPPKLEGKSTPKSYLRMLAQISNSLLVFDEYKNSINYDLIAMLKGLHDGEGYDRAKMDNTNKTFSTSVRSTAIICGQEMPNCEPALFSRFLLLEFETLKDLDDNKRRAYDQLVTLEANNLSCVLTEILSHRAHFQNCYKKNFLEVRNLFRKSYQKSEVIERQILIASAIVAAFTTLETVLEIPFNVSELTLLVEKAIDRQTTMMNTADEVQHFFEIVGVLLREHKIKDESEIKFHNLQFKYTGEGDEQQIVYSGGIVIFRMKLIYPLYRERLIRLNMKPLDAGTLERYLKSSVCYEKDASCRNYRFRSLQNPTTGLCFLQSKLVEKYDIDLNNYLPRTIDTE